MATRRPATNAYGVRPLKGTTTYRPPKPTSSAPALRPASLGAPRAPSAPSVGGQVVSPQAAPQAAQRAPADPRDSNYWLDLAKLQSGFQRFTGDYEADEANDARDTARALALMAERKPEDIRETQESANRAGLFYSGHLGKKLGDLEVNYARQAQQLQEGLTDRQKARKRAMDEAIRNRGFAEQDALNAGVGRATERDSQLALANALASPSAPSAPLQGATPKIAPKAGFRFVQSSGPRAGLSYNVIQKNGRNYRRYENGDTVPV